VQACYGDVYVSFIVDETTERKGRGIILSKENERDGEKIPEKGQTG
jgi:hypothetical protein